MQCTFNGIVEHDVLFGQFQQHGVVKEIVDRDCLTVKGGEGRECVLSAKEHGQRVLFDPT